MWTRNGTNYERTVPKAIAFDPTTDVAEVRVNGGSPVPAEEVVNADGTVTLRIPTNLFPQAGDYQVQFDVVRTRTETGRGPDGEPVELTYTERHTVDGRAYTASADTLSPKPRVHPRAALRQAIVGASTVAAVKAALLAYLDDLDP